MNLKYESAHALCTCHFYHMTVAYSRYVRQCPDHFVTWVFPFSAGNITAHIYFPSLIITIPFSDFSLLTIAVCCCIFLFFFFLYFITIKWEDKKKKVSVCIIMWVTVYELFIQEQPLSKILVYLHHWWHINSKVVLYTIFLFDLHGYFK